MLSNTCWQCLSRAAHEQSAFTLSCLRFSRIAGGYAAFSTSANLAANPTPKKKGMAVGVPKRGQGATFQRKKKRVVMAKTSSPRTGERKALRRRIVLSNTSALEVPDLKDMTEDNIKEPRNIGRMVSIPNHVIDQLRAVQAFKKTQSWGLFRKPSMLIRKETVEMAKDFDDLEQKTLRKIFTGERGSGKSLLMLQTTALAFLKGWIVLTIPEAQYVTDGSADYRPKPNVRPPVYEQRQTTVALIRRTLAANPNLAKLKISIEHQLPVPVQPNASMADLLNLGAYDLENSPAIWDAFLEEIYAPGRPSILLVMDGLTYAMRETAYKSPTFQPVHAHDLSLVQWFMGHLSGEKPLPNGGIVLAAVSSSNDPKVETLRFRLHQLEIKQAIEKGLPNPAKDAELPPAMLPFLLATGQQPDPVPQPDPYHKYDERVFDVLGSPFGVVAGNKTVNGNEVQVQALKGLSKEEARGLMEYWAKSGMMRQEINDGLVGERWSLSGGGVVGELERACVRFKI